MGNQKRDLEELVREVDDMAEAGMKACGAHASPWDRAYYAAQILFPDAGEEAWRLMADFVIIDGE